MKKKKKRNLKNEDHVQVDDIISQEMIIGVALFSGRNISVGFLFYRPSLVSTPNMEEKSTRITRLKCYDELMHE